MTRFYGPPGEHMTRIEMPFPLRLAWDTGTIVRRVTVHEKCADAFGEIWKDVLAFYGLDRMRALGLDLFGGCLNVRKMRGGNAWSIHSWGAAWDVDPDRNQLQWGRDKAELAKPCYADFWRIVEDHGGVSLGRAKNYDWMHLQFARL